MDPDVIRIDLQAANYSGTWIQQYPLSGGRQIYAFNRYESVYVNISNHQHIRTDVNLSALAPNSVVEIRDLAGRSTAIGFDAAVFGAEPNPRFSGVISFFMGDGNDVVDLTSGPGGRNSYTGSVTFFGGDGNDVLWGGAGSDVVLGENGNDNLAGGAGPDTLIGGAGSDVLRGGGGIDFLYGGDGGDILIGGAGNDQLAGDAGADLFTYTGTAAFGADTVTDFDRAAGDRVDLATGMTASFSGNVATIRAGSTVLGTITEDTLGFVWRAADFV